jgi:putative hydrolase of the HAD superfamily
MFDNLFEVEIYSFQIGVTKPHRKAFELILNALASKPSKCIFIDDQDINLLAAKKIGMSPVKFINPNQLLYSLKNLEVKISGF